MSTLSKIKNLVFSKSFLVNIIAIIGSLFIVIILLNIYLKSSTSLGEKIEVPNLVGKNEANLGSILGGVDLLYEVSESVYDPSKPDGTVLAQDPKPSKITNVFVKSGRTIRVKVSKNTQVIDLPVLIDKSERFATNILNSRGFKYRIEYKPSVESAGAVIDQLYQGKRITEVKKVPIGAVITLIIGKRAETMDVLLPNLVGLNVCEAKSRLSGMPYINLVLICQDCATAADSCNALINLQTPEYFEERFIPGASTITVHASK